MYEQVVKYFIKKVGECKERKGERGYDFTILRFLAVPRPNISHFFFT